MEERQIKYKVTFPMLGNYDVIAYHLLTKLVDPHITEIIPPKKNSMQTIEKGSNASPDFVCVPFKYTLGNYIEALEKGANVLIQAGGGCRYGYYAELQEQILKDMGYQFIYISCVEGRGVNLLDIYHKLKLLNPNLTLKNAVYHGLLAVKMVDVLDRVENYIRDHMVYEKEKGTFECIQKDFLACLKTVNTLHDLKRMESHFLKQLKQVTLQEKAKQEQMIKVGIVGELYTSMEPFATYFLEKELTKMQIQTKRYTTVTYLLFQKGKEEKKILQKANKYIDYTFGADGAESIAHTLELIEQGYDGIIHIKPFGCSPEINAMPILQKISEDTGVPIMYLTFDAQTSETGIKTRLEAFHDMLQMKKESESKEIKVESIKENKKLVEERI